MIDCVAIRIDQKPLEIVALRTKVTFPLKKLGHETRRHKGRTKILHGAPCQVDLTLLGVTGDGTHVAREA